MLRIIITGAKGRMGQALLACAARDPELQITGQVDAGGDLESVIGQGDVVIDFSSHDATAGLAAICSRHKKAMVIGTTGHSPSERAHITKLKSKIPARWLLELFDRHQHAVLVDAKSRGNSRPRLRS